MKNKHLTILITGGAGFIGSSLIEKLILNNNWKIVCLDNLNDYYSPARKKSNLEPFNNKDNFVFYKTDITDYKGLETIFKKHKINKIIHLAARAGVRASIKQPVLYEKVNVFGTLNLLELARKYKVPHFIFGSSSSVYGNQNKVPFSETDPCNHPISPYAATKKATELLCNTYAYLYDINITALRFFTVYGPKGRPDMAPYLFTKAILEDKIIYKFGDGTTRRDYTYIDDIIKGIIKAINKPFSYKIINLGNNKPITLNKFIQAIENATGKKARIKQKPLPEGDVNQTYADIRKANKLLSWHPTINIEKGLASFVDWYKKTKLNSLKL